MNMKRVFLAGIILSSTFFFHSATATSEAESVRADLMQILLRQNVSSDRIFGGDSVGIPLVSALPVLGVSGRSAVQQVASSSLPAGTRGWETTPGVIRNDGQDTFRVEVD